MLINHHLKEVIGVGQPVPVCLSSYMPRPDDTGRPSGIPPVGC